ncbi:hypothetical protein ACHAPT_010120 [Fusarium lateritium]
MTEPRDVAFSCRGWAYDTGRVDRPKRRVIRVNTVHTTKSAETMLTINDTTGAGFVISPNEKDIEGVDFGLLAVVVGEFLPAEVPEFESFTHPLRLHDFDPAIHTLVETRPQTHLVVAIIGQKKCTLHILHDKEPNGLSYLQQAIGRIRELEQTPLKSQPDPNEASMGVIRHLMEGKEILSETKAGDAVHAFKDLWPYQFEMVGGQSININSIIELSKSLCAISASTMAIHESLYRGVIVSFCIIFSELQAAGAAGYHGNMIQSPIRIARVNAPAPMPVHSLVRTDDDNPGVTLLTKLVQDNHTHMEHSKAWARANGHMHSRRGDLGQLRKVVRLANVVLGTQNQEAILTALEQVKRLVLVSAFGTVSRLPVLLDYDVQFFQVALHAAVHAVTAHAVGEFATQAGEEADTVDTRPTLAGLPGDMVGLADKFFDLYQALDTVTEQDARDAASEAVRVYLRKYRDAPGSSSLLGLGLPLNIDRSSVLLRYMRQVMEREYAVPSSQDLDMELE